MNGSPVRCMNFLTSSSWPFRGCAATTVWMLSSISLPRVFTYSGVTSHAPTPWIGDFTENSLKSPIQGVGAWLVTPRSEEHTSELQSRPHLVCRLLLEKKKIQILNPRDHRKLDYH